MLRAAAVICISLEFFGQFLNCMEVTRLFSCLHVLESDPVILEECHLLSLLSPQAFLGFLRSIRSVGGDVAEEGLELRLEEGIVVVLFLVRGQHLEFEGQAFGAGSGPTNVALGNFSFGDNLVFSLMFG